MLDCGGDLLRRARCCAGTDFGPNCRYSNPGTLDSVTSTTTSHAASCVALGAALRE